METKGKHRITGKGENKVVTHHLKAQGVITLVLVSLLGAGGCDKQPAQSAEPIDIAGSFDQRVYAPGSNIRVTLQAPAANLDPKLTESMTAELTVWLDKDRERIALTETSPDSGVFVSNEPLPVSPEASTINDGRLQAAPGQVVELRYTGNTGADARLLDQAGISGGKFSYQVDPTIEVPVLDEPTRPIVAVVNPGGWQDEFIGNELIVKTTDETVIQSIVIRYAGRLLHDGDLSGLDRRGSLQGETGYALIRVEPDKADLRNIEKRLTEAGLSGKFLLSSRKALQMAAIILEQQALQRHVELNMLMHTTRCPCQSTSENAGVDAFSFTAIGNDVFRVHRAWQFLDGIGLPDQATTAPADSPWVAHFERTSGTRPVWAPVRLGIMDVNFGPNTDWPHANIADYDCYFHTYTPVVGWHAVSSWCGGYERLDGRHVGWHGSGIYAVAAALLDNTFGTAGSCGMCRGADDERLHPLLSKFHETITRYETAMNTESLLRLAGGADVINMSFGGECNWWCQTFAGSEIAGTDMLRDALRSARDQGTIVVAAAGNDERDIGHEYWWGPRMLLPCEGPSVICVGAVERFSGGFTAARTGLWPAGRTWGSNFGEGVDIWAPTDFDVSRPPWGDHGYPPASHVFGNFGGTSAATAYVSGVMSMLKALYPPDRRAEFDAAAAMAQLAASARSLGVDARVDGDGGLIDPFAMTLAQGAVLGLDPAMADIHEPNNARAEATWITAGGVASGIAAPNNDSDWYGFLLSDYWDLTVNLNSATEPGQIRAALSDASGAIVPLSSPPLTASLDPGTYYLRVEDDRSGGFDFNCHEVGTALALTPIAPDIFDDGDPSTPPPGPWPMARNDTNANRTQLNLADDPDERRSQLGFDNLNFDLPADADFFQVQLPPNAGEGCLCPPGSVGTNALLRIVVRAEQRVRVRIYAPRETPWVVETWHELEPLEQGWGGGWHSYQEIDLLCPDQLTGELPDGERVPVLTDDRALVFSIQPDSGRSDYDLDIEYTYQNCEVPHFPFDPMDMRAVFGWQGEEEIPTLFPAASMGEFWDCLALPGCDPAEEDQGYYLMEWPGGEFSFYINYASPAQAGTLSAALLNTSGQSVLQAVEVAPGQGPVFESPEGTVFNQTLLLATEDLPAGWYAVQVNAPVPGTFSWRQTAVNQPPQ